MTDKPKEQEKDKQVEQEGEQQSVPFFIYKAKDGEPRVAYDVDVLLHDVLVMVQNAPMAGEHADASQVLFDLIAGLAEVRKLKYSYKEENKK